MDYVLVGFAGMNDLLTAFDKWDSVHVGLNQTFGWDRMMISMNILLSMLMTLL